MNRRGFLTKFMLAAAAMTLVPFMAMDEASAEEYTITLQTVAPAGTPWARQLKRIKKRWEAESEGRLKVKLFLGRGNEISIVRKTKAGELQACAVSTAAMVEEVPEMGIFELPYLFKNEQEADRIIDKVLAKPIDDLLNNNGFKLYVFSQNGYRNFATKGGKKIQKASDLSTLKMRTQENWIHEETYRALGGNPVRISVAEVLTSLSTGQVDGFDNTPLFAMATSWFSEIDTWTVSDHIFQPAVIVFNKKWWDKLPADLQAIVLKDKEKETTKGRRAVRKLTPKLHKLLESKGIAVYKMTDAEKAEFQKKTKKVHKMFRKRVGKQGAKLLDLVEKNK